MADLFTKREAVFSSEGRYRNFLLIQWDERPMMGMVGLNPSKADKFRNDPTVVRQCKRAEQFGCGGLVMLNAFDIVSTDPYAMLDDPEPNSEKNTVEFLNSWLMQCSIRIAAWGKHANEHRSFPNRGEFLKQSLYRLDCLGFNSDGSPKHPLYLPYAQRLQPYNYGGAA